MDTTQESPRDRADSDSRGDPRGSGGGSAGHWVSASLEQAIECGTDLVAVGGDLDPRRLLCAYTAGVFPWYEEDSPVLWWCPDPRAVLEPDGLHVSRRLARTIRSGRFRTTFNEDFPAVIRECARGRAEGTWITPKMISAYIRLHRLAHAHSVECWLDGRLAGGVYGVSVGGFFAGESMFHRVADASKVALVALVEGLRERGFTLFDLQILNDYTRQFGATEIPRSEYLARLAAVVRLPVAF